MDALVCACGQVGAFLSTPNEVLLNAGLPLKLGFLFHGPPGTGKTHLVRYIAAKYSLDIDVARHRRPRDLRHRHRHRRRDHGRLHGTL